MTNDTKALTDIFEGNGPVSSLFMLGYAGWYPGQLEKEIKEGILVSSFDKFIASMISDSLCCLLYTSPSPRD